MIDIIMESFVLLVDWLRMFLSLSVTIGGIMVDVLKWLFQLSSHILTVLHFVKQLLLWAIDFTWLVTGVVLDFAVIAGGWLTQCVYILWQVVVVAMGYCYYGISFLPNQLYDLVIQGYSITVSVTTSSWYFLKQSAWPQILHCAKFTISFIVSAAILLYDMLSVLWDYIVITVVTIVRFTQDSILPYMITIFSGLFYVLLGVIEYCYTMVIAIIYYLTNFTLQITELLPGTLQPVTTDLVYYTFDFVSTIVTTIFDILSHFIRSCTNVVEFILTSPAFWALLLAAVTLSVLFFWFNKYWSVRRPAPVVIAAVNPVVTTKERQEESRERRIKAIMKSVADHQSSVTTGKDETYAAKKIEKLEEEMLCVVCQANKKNVLLQPCNHVCLCPSCVTEVMKQNCHCPLCRKHISKWTKVYL